MKPLDISGLDAEQAARKLYDYLSELCKELDMDPEIEMMLVSPEDAPTYGHSPHWRVVWESGPFEWGICLSGGESIFCAELGEYGSDPEVIYQNDKWFLEPHYSFDVGFITD